MQKIFAILREYTTLHTDFPGYVTDTSWLPADKEKIKRVLKLSWLQAKNDETRNWFETGWYFLCWFQNGVGQIPIDVTAKPRKDIPAIARPFETFIGTSPDIQWPFSWEMRPSSEIRCE